MDKLVPLDLPAGMRNNGTVYQAKDRWYTGNLVRFFQDTIQPVGGWDARTLTGDAIVGVPRAMITYRINSGAQIIVVGTVSNIYAISGSVVTDITPVGFPVSATRIWQLDVFGTWLIACDLNAPKTAGACYYWTGDTATNLVQLGPFDGTDPTRALSIVGTPERFMVTLGSLYTASGYVALGKNANSRRVTWATQEAGFDVGDWTPSASNTAGDFELTTIGSLVCGKRGRGLTLLWTTTDLWTMTYIGGDFIFRFDQAANECGIISSHAAVVTNVGAFWMGENGFFMYEGFVSPIPCEVQDYVFGSLNRTYAHYIWALENPTFNEVTWFYPHAAQTEITRYVTYNYVEKHWTTGTLERTAGVSQQPGTHTFPVMTDADGVVYNHESGMNRGTSDPAYLESGPLEIEDGDRVISLQKVVPDDDTVGDVNLTIYTAPNPDTAETANGPYTLTAQTSVRLKARQMRVKLTEVPSLDNATFAARTTPSNTAWSAVCYSPSLERFVAVSYSGVAAPVMTSDDGVTWTAQTAGTVAQLWNDVIWVEDLGLFVAVSDGSGTTDNVMTSPDGIVWTLRTAPDNSWIAVEWNGTTLVAVSYNNTDNVMTSTNGTAWTGQVSSGIALGLTDIAWSSTLSLFAACDGGDIFSSTNGIDWTLRENANQRTDRIVWAPALAKFFVSSDDPTGMGNGGVYASSNGTAWTFQQFDAGTMASPRALAWAESAGILMALDSGSTEVMTSTDGATWTVETGIADDWYDLVWGEELGTFAAASIAGSGTEGMATSQATASDWRVGTIRLGVLPSSRR